MIEEAGILIGCRWPMVRLAAHAEGKNDARWTLLLSSSQVTALPMKIIGDISGMKSATA